MTIRPIRPQDAEALAELYRANHDFLVPFEHDLVTRREVFTAEGQSDRLSRQVAGGTHPFAIVAGDEIVGTINLFHIVRTPLRSGTISYWVDGARNGRGLATAAITEILEFAFGKLGLHRVDAVTHADNISSQRVLKKNGFERIGAARHLLRIHNERRDFRLAGGLLLGRLVLFQRLPDH